MSNNGDESKDKKFVRTNTGATSNSGSSSSSDDDDVEQMRFKIILLGDGAVGKTSITMRFCEDYFANQYKQTFGVDFFSKRLLLPGDVQASLQIWDIGGQTIGSKMIGNYVFGSHAILLCYDVTNYASFQNLEDWYRVVEKTFSSAEKKPNIYVIGNKSDLQYLRVVKYDRHKKFVESNNFQDAFMSAKSGDNIQRTFFRIAADLAGVTLTKAELEGASQVVTAEIVNHPQNDPTQKDIKIDKPKSKCTVQ